MELKQTVRCCQGRAEIRTLVHRSWEYEMGQLLWETAWRAFKKLKLELPSDPRSLLLNMYPSKGEEDFWKDIVHTCSQQNYGQNPKGGRNPNVQGEKNGSTTCGTHTTWNIYHGIVFGLKKQEDSDTCCNIEESRGHYVSEIRVHLSEAPSVSKSQRQ